jgi:hypothetical protein
MTIEEQIQTLLANADLLRPLAEDDPEKARLTVIVDEINRLRDLQGRAEARRLIAQADEMVASQPKRGPGRPKKEA